MAKKYIRWTDEMLYAEARKYNHRNEFKKFSENAYSRARQRNMLDFVCSHMEDKIIYWTYDKILEEALKFTSRNDFCNNSSAYQSAIKKGIIDDVCSHMKYKHEKWNINKVKNIAINYTTRYEFQKKEKLAYNYAWRNGLIDDVCSHMPTNDTGFKPSNTAILYYIKIENDKIEPLYKIGITNTTVKERISRMRISDEYNTTILKEFQFKLGKSACVVEKLLHKKFKEFRYTGDKIMDNGNTELYIVDVLSLGVING